MKNEDQNTNKHKANIDESFFSKLEVKFDLEKQDVWAQMEGKLQETPHAKRVQFFCSRVFMAAAASLVILLSSALMMRFYSHTISTNAGQYETITLPDESIVELNAGSTLKYYPFWWRFSRSLELSGEGFFEIAKGKTLEVISENGTTEVLGTSFNIYNRNDDYRVTCFTGKVKVTSNTKQEVILTPDYHAEIDASGNILVNKMDKQVDNPDWQNDMFNFSSVPLTDVFEELERQYNVEIALQQPTDKVYTGYFPKSSNIEIPLSIICKPFGLTFVKQSERKYLIVQK
jgi:ferric-dicitrate binding protein FerR (iron transport regulator)